LKRYFVKSRIPCCNALTSVIHRLSRPIRYDPTGGFDDGNQRLEIVSVVPAFDHQIDHPSREHAVRVAITSVASERRARSNRSEGRAFIALPEHPGIGGADRGIFYPLAMPGP